MGQMTWDNGDHIFLSIVAEWLVSHVSSVVNVTYTRLHSKKRIADQVNLFKWMEMNGVC